MLERVNLEHALERFFESKRSNFLEDYELQARPALIWQCSPSESVEVDLPNGKVREAMRDGGGPTSNDGWWHGFKMSYRPVLVFDGLSSTTDLGGGAGWATEIHIDGHLTAGIWTFPSRTASGSAGTGVGAADFYSDAFIDFVRLAGKVYEAADFAGAVHVTCTMHRANDLPLLSGYDRVLSPAPRRTTLRWPITTVETKGLPEAGTAMAAQFMRIYGRSLPKA